MKRSRMVFKYYGNSGCMNCAILSFFDKLHLTSPDKKFGCGGREVNKDSRDNRER